MVGFIVDGELMDDLRIEKLEAFKRIDDEYMQRLRVAVGEAATLEAGMTLPPDLLKAIETFAGCVREVIEKIAEALSKLEIVEKLKEFEEYYREEDDVDLTREEWREVEALDAQKAAARARSYAGALAIERAREIRRRRKWRKRIDDRVHIIRK